MGSWDGGPAISSRLLDERHALIVEAVATLLVTLGWMVFPEVSYSEWGERGSIDLLAGHRAARAAVAFEIKSDLTSVEETIRRHDQKTRLVANVLAKRKFGWQPRVTGGVLVVPEDPRLRRLVDAHRITFESAYPMRSRAIRRWLRAPDRSLAALWFLTLKPVGARKQKRSAPRRVRVADSAPD